MISDEGNLLSKQTEHVQQLLKMVKNLQKEKKDLLQQIENSSNNTSQLDVVGKQHEINTLTEINRELRNDLTQISNKFIELDELYTIEKERNSKLEEQLELLQYKLILKDKEIYAMKQEQSMEQSILIQSGMRLSVTNSESTLNQSIAAQQQYRHSQIASNTKQVNLFEEFFIITVPSTQIKTTNAEPKVIFQHPTGNKDGTKELVTQLPQFVFPRGCKTEFIRDSLKENIIKILKDDITHVHNCNLLVFTPCRATGQHIRNTFIMEANPDQLLYGVVVETTDFYAEKRSNQSADIVQLKKQGITQNVHKVQIAYVILTYFPFFVQFNEIITKIIRTMKNRRLDLILQNQKQEIDLRQVDAEFFTIFEQEIRDHLNLLQCTDIPPPIPTHLSLMDGSHYPIPKLPNHMYQFACAPLNLFQGWNAKQLVQIFASLILENKVVIFGYSRIQNSIDLGLFFNQVIKPLQYPHPFIMNVPDTLLPLVDAPVPVFLGFHKQFFSTDECVLVDVQRNPIKLHNLPNIQSGVLNRIEQQSQQLVELLQRQDQQQEFLRILCQFIQLFRGFVDQEIIKNPSVNDPFIVRLRQTQLYQLFIGDNSY